ncbi:phosphotransferase family protein [Sphingomonas sp. ID0503]|uniref:phosphotransferase family protein n=1 Tax=Sphingomonas sp. ID0503 TaxID=3399691 RepID=UPI003AFA9E9C
MSWAFTPDVEQRLHAFLANRGLATGPIEISRIGEGHSNLTFRVRSGGRAVVLRRPPPPPLPPGSNDVLREAMFIGAVEGRGVPVPKLLATGQAGDVFDVPFFVMDMVDGVVITDVLPSALSAAGTPRLLAEAMVDAMAALHRVDWRAAGLADAGRPEGFNARHLHRIARIVTEADGEIAPEFVGLYRWLSAHVPPESGSAIVHNDFRLGNLMWDRAAPPRLAAALDWELATIGDPLLDLAYLVTAMPQQGVCRTPVQDLAAALVAPDLPDAATICGRYFAATGSAPQPLAWHAVMVNWKLAALYRYSRLRGEDAYFADRCHEARFLAEAERWCPK